MNTVKHYFFDFFKVFFWIVFLTIIFFDSFLFIGSDPVQNISVCFEPGPPLHNFQLVSTVHMLHEQWRSTAKFADENEEKEGEGGEEEEATLHGGDVQLTVATAEADGERRELLGRWKVALLICQLFLLFFFLSVSATLYFCFRRFSPLLWWCCCYGQ